MKERTVYRKDLDSYIWPCCKARDLSSKPEIEFMPSAVEVYLNHWTTYQEISKLNLKRYACVYGSTIWFDGENC